MLAWSSSLLPGHFRRPCHAGLALLLAAGTILAPAGIASAAESALSEEPIPLRPIEDLPTRTPPIIEIGPSFLGTGDIPEGIELPTGAVWTPALWVFGNLRSAVNYVEPGDNGPSQTLEWANRLDIFANLRLSGTERFLIGFRPIDEDSEFSGYIFEPASRKGFVSAFDPEPSVFFFEGEIVEIFPDLDPEDSGFLDVGFSIGRQPIVFQDGMMFNDNIDAVAITRDTIVAPGVVDTRATLVYGWGEVNRDDNIEDKNSMVVGLFTETDLRAATVEIDGAYVRSTSEEDGDGLFFGVGSTQRIGKINTTFRANASFAIDDESAAVSTGALLFSQFSMDPLGNDDVAYVNGYWGIEDYSSAARDRDTGGPLGQVGLLFASVGLGNYGAPLSNRADESAGGALGYQAFFNENRTQIVLEVGGRKSTGDAAEGADAVAIGSRFQQAIGSRWILRLDGFLRWHETFGEGAGVRTELQTIF